MIYNACLDLCWPFEVPLKFCKATIPTDSVQTLVAMDDAGGCQGNEVDNVAMRMMLVNSACSMRCWLHIVLWLICAGVCNDGW